MTYKPKKQPVGFVDPDERTLRAMKALYHDGDYWESLRILEGSREPIHRLRRVVLPRAYVNENELVESRGQWRLALDAVKSDYDDAGYWNAIGSHETFEVAYQQDNCKDDLASYGEWVTGLSRRLFPGLHEPLPSRNGKLKLGLASRHLESHNGSTWALGWVQDHPGDVEVHVIQLGQKVDFVTEAFKEAADYAHHLPVSPHEAARYMQRLGLDVLVYTDIGMSGKSAQMASFRIAPIQCTAWGHPVTSGFPEIDYYLSSELMEPEGSEAHYSERLVKLPGSGLRYINGLPEVKKVDGLPGAYFFMAQNVMKVLPRYDELFRQVSELAPIVICSAVGQAERRITCERWEKAGVDFILLPFQSPSEFLGVMQGAKASLDTPGWSGGNTTIQAMKLRTPVVSMKGDTMRANHSLCFLSQGGLSEWVSDSPEGYIDLAKRALEGERISPDMGAVTGRSEPKAALYDFVRTNARKERTPCLMK